MGVDSNFECESYVLILVLRDQLLLLRLVLSFFARVVLVGQLKDLLNHLFWVLLQLVDSVLDEKHMLHAGSLLLFLLLRLLHLLKLVPQAALAFVHVDFFVQGQENK